MNPHKHEIALTLSTSAFYRLIGQGVIVDGRAGGLLVGRTAVDGGIAVIRQSGDRFDLLFERTEDGAFVLHPGLRVRPRRVYEPLHEVRSFSHLLITSAKPNDKILWVRHDQQIVRPELAAGRLDVYALMNDHENPYLTCDFDDVFDGASMERQVATSSVPERQ